MHCVVSKMGIAKWSNFTTFFNRRMGTLAGRDRVVEKRVLLFCITGLS